MTDNSTHLTKVPDIAPGPNPDGVSVSTTKLLLATGDELEIEGPLDKVLKELEDAARSSAGTLARFTLAGTGEPTALNAAHVVAVRPGG